MRKHFVGVVNNLVAIVTIEERGGILKGIRSLKKLSASMKDRIALVEMAVTL
jgi:hypothetical protein